MAVEPLLVWVALTPLVWFGAKGFTAGGKCAILAVLALAMVGDYVQSYSRYPFGMLALVLAGGTLISFQWLAGKLGRRHRPRSQASVAWNALPGVFVLLVLAWMGSAGNLWAQYNAVYALSASLAAALADTVGGEFGLAVRAKPFWPAGAAPGDRGAISLHGTAWGLAAAFSFGVVLNVIVRPLVYLERFTLANVLESAVTLGVIGMAASLVESWLGARSRLGSGPRNAICAATGATLLLAHAWYGMFS